MTSPGSRQPPWRRVGRIALSILQTLLPMSAGVFDKKQTRYWQAMPLRRMAWGRVAMFLTVAAWGFFLDLPEWRRLPPWALLISASLFGATGVVFFVMMRRRVFKLI